MSISTRTTERNIYIYIAAISAVLNAVLLVAPILASKLSADLGLEPAQVGLIASVELGCFSLATVPAFLWLRKVNIRKLTFWCLLVVITGNVLSSMTDSFGSLLAVRAVTSFAAGSIIVVILSLSAKAANPSRAYGLFVVSQLAMGAIILFLFPVIYAQRSVSAVYLTLAALAALCLFCTLCVKGNELHAVPGERAAVQRRVFPFACALIAVLGFYVALGGVWTFMGQIAIASQIPLDTASSMIGIATLFGVAASFVSTLVGENSRARYFVLGGFVLMGISIAFLYGMPGLIRFVLAAVLFKIAWSWLLPFLLAEVSRVGGPQVMNATNMVIGGGLAIGPMLAGTILQTTGSFTVMLTVALSILAVAVLASLVVFRAANVSAGEAEQQSVTA
ncbi:MFS transporter [Glutamicibacter endophyticus]|uniref:MFS transporter n=1 Tax=Glutamicibacter endophyticus TaxID=1522174 RepID=UPI003AEF53CB